MIYRRCVAGTICVNVGAVLDGKATVPPLDAADRVRVVSLPADLVICVSGPEQKCIRCAGQSVFLSLSPFLFLFVLCFRRIIPVKKKTAALDTRCPSSSQLFF